MKIKEIVLEGFKSYGSRTSLNHLDPAFNAITGLNGSGKSNILEAICFVLGLSKWSIARATSIRELIYKNGQAGIKTASVKIVFDNRDKNFSPINMEAHDIISIERVIKNEKTQYFLNGKKETNSNLKKIFKSIGLNMENHCTFFVPQGKITSIVNFQPRELMKFIEETAGVRYFNDVKKDAEKNMKNKGEKLAVVGDLIDKDIKPELDILEKEKKKNEEYRDNQKKIETVGKKLRLYKKKQGQEELEKAKKEKKKIEEDLIEYENKLANCKEQLSKFDERIKEFKDNGLGLNNELAERSTKLRKDIGAISEELDELNSLKKVTEKLIDRLNNQFNNCKKKEKELIFNLTSCNKEILFIQDELQKTELDIGDLKGQMGKSSQGEFLKEKLEELQTETNNLNTKKTQFERKLNNIEEDFKEIKKTREEVKKQNKEQTIKKKELEKEINTLESELKSLSNKNGKEEKVEKEFNELKIAIGDKQELKKKVLGRLHYFFELSYNRKARNDLPKEAIKGKVHNLMTVENPSKFNSALEAIAGGKLFYIVVDTDNNCKKIMERKIIQGTMNLIPVNKIRSKILQPHLLTTYQKIAEELGGTIWNPLQVIRYDEDLKPAFQFVFANNLIVSSEEIAVKIAFDKKIGIRCVTLNGDSFDPSGTLHGGYKDPNSSFLAKSTEVKEINNELLKLFKKKKEVEKKLNENEMRNVKIAKDTNTLGILKRDRDKLEEKISTMNEEVINAKLTDKEREIQFVLKEIDKIKTKTENNKKEIEGLSKQVQKGGGGKAFIKQKLDERNNTKNKLIKELNSYKENLEEMSQQKKSLINEIKVLKEKLEKSNKELEEKNRDILECEESKRKLDDEYEKLGSEIEENNIKRSRRQIKRLDYEKQRNRFQTEMEELNQLIQTTEKDLKQITQLLKELKQKTKNNKSQSQSQTQERTDKIDIPLQQLIKEIDHLEKVKADLEDTNNNLAKQLNKAAETEFNQMNKQFTSLENNFNEVHTNKDMFIKNINLLDQKKTKTVDNCFNKVNASFGKIFSSFLPNANAQMKMVRLTDRKTRLETLGIEIGISFNGKWKDSLSELSGGQRSLLALSFLLALLSYHSAPFYIFDEVDAALDLSHTENLGSLISKHFPQSQFLIISLKDELFTSANVLFRTSLESGQSRVDRFIGSKVTNSS